MEHKMGVSTNAKLSLPYDFHLLRHRLDRRSCRRPWGLQALQIKQLIIVSLHAMLANQLLLHATVAYQRRLTIMHVCTTIITTTTYVLSFCFTNFDFFACNSLKQMEIISQKRKRRYEIVVLGIGMKIQKKRDSVHKL